MKSDLFFSIKAYKSHLKKWGQGKYLMGSDVDKVLLQIRPTDDDNENADDMEITEKDMQKIMRHLQRRRHDAKHRRKSQQTSAQFEKPRQPTVPNALLNPEKEQSRLPSSPDPTQNTNRVRDQSQADQADFEKAANISEPFKMALAAFARDQRNMEDISRNISGRHPMLNGRLALPYSGILGHVSPESRCLELIKRSIHIYCQEVDPFLIDDPGVGVQTQLWPSYPAAKFWQDVKYGIYLIKVSSKLGWPTLKTACLEAESVLGSRFFNCIRELLTTCSPANTTLCPGLRRVLLEHFSAWSQRNLGPNHPLSVVGEQLRRDQGCAEVSEEALKYMVARFEHALGSNNTVTVRARTALVKHLRRNRKYEAAAWGAQELLASCIAKFGLESPLSRSAGREMAHVLMDQGHHRQAIQLGESVVGMVRNFGHSPIMVLHHDDYAVHSMEDMAKSYDILGDFESSAAWLSLAVEHAWALWRKWVATEHIVDKLERALRACGRSYEIQSWRDRFPAIAEDVS